MKKIIFLFALLILSAEVFSQISAVNQNWINTRSSQFNNPAFAGLQNKYAIQVGYLAEYVDVPGAARNAYLGFEIPIPAKNSNLGAYFKNRIIGEGNTKEIYLGLAYNYVFHLNGDAQFRVGIAGELAQIAWTEWDNSSAASLVPNLNAGAFYMVKRFYAGVGLRNLTSPVYRPDGVKNDQMKFAPQAQVGYDIQLPQEFNLLPNISYEHPGTEAGYFTGNLMALYKNRYMLGLTYQYKSSNLTNLLSGGRLGVEAGVRFLKVMRVDVTYGKMISFPGSFNDFGFGLQAAF